jgi:adenylosuccinate synthase
MPVSLVVGGQWGDEGKAKIIDYLARDVDYVVRFQGGANAGHTVVTDGERFAFHLVPSGILYPSVTCILGGGMVIDPTALVSEINDIVGRGIDVTDRILISAQAHLVLPYHKVMDEGAERRKGDESIGTTRKGITPAYADKICREGVRMGDLVKKKDDLTNLLKVRIRDKNRELKSLGLKPVSPKRVIEDVLAARKRLMPMIMDTRPILWDAIDDKKKVLCEGAQGSLLDIDHGTYPFVTSSSATAGGAAIGSGIPPSAFGRVIGIFKAYCTRVGNGPFPTEDGGKEGDRLREEGNEYGTTTGRPRRCGWFDAVAARTVVRLNGITDIALTKLDVLDSFDQVKVCTSYKLGSRTTEYFPTCADDLEDVKPQYESFAGWTEPTKGKDLETMPRRAVEYVRYLEKLVGCRIHLVSLGPERSAMVTFPKSGAARAVYPA